ncbi:MAG: hypothetical protein ABI867_22660 [Kofleriaceae bacterium]
MAKSPFSKRDEQHELTRRALIKWTVAAGAALGVSRSKIFDILEKTGGKGLAEAASSNPTHRYIGLAAGNGGLAWFTLLWPLPTVGASNDPNASYPAGMGNLFPGTPKPLWVGDYTPWMDEPAGRQMTVFVAGANNTHNSTAQQGSNVNGSNIFAAVSVMQAPTPSVIPIIQVADATVGAAPGFGQPTNVTNGQAIVGLFNSAASRAGGLLATSGNAQLYKTQYDAFAQLNRAAGRTTQKGSYLTASSAATFLGTNLASKLSITDADRVMYGLDGSTRGNVRDIAETLIVTVKAFGLGLTNAVTLPAMRDDPHGAWNGAGGATGDVPIVAPQLKKVFDGLKAHLTATIDSVTGQTLWDDTVITVSGDTTKTGFARNGWGDGTVMNHNLIFVKTPGHIDAGYHGNVTNNAAQGIQPNGTLGNYDPNQSALFANSSILYAIAKRDKRAIQTITGNLPELSWLHPLDQ